MIFKSSLDELVEYIRSDELMYVGTREVICEWLERNKNKPVSPTHHMNEIEDRDTYNKVTDDTKFIPHLIQRSILKQCLSQPPTTVYSIWVRIKCTTCCSTAAMSIVNASVCHAAALRTVERWTYRTHQRRTTQASSTCSS